MLNSEPQTRRPIHSLALPAALLGVVAGIGAILYARRIEPKSLMIRSLDLAIPTLPDELDGLKIGFVSDFHLGGPGDNLPIANQAIALLEQLRPELILLGGDYFDKGTRTGSEPEWARLSAIAPTYGVPGNHDYRLCPDAAEDILESLASAGIRILRNESARVQVRGSALTLIGLDDPYLGYADFERATVDLSEHGGLRIILAHAGMIADSLPIGSADLILSGHTHGAQIRVSPFRHTGPLDAFWWLDRFKQKPMSPYRQGLFHVRGSLLYVGNGLGMTGFGVRFLAPPEVALFTLHKSEGNVDRACDDPDRYVLDTSIEHITF